jgi:hypothetical protein
MKRFFFAKKIKTLYKKKSAVYNKDVKRMGV